MMRSTPFYALFLLLVSTACLPASESCAIAESVIGYDEASAGGSTPREAMAHVEGARVGTLTWADAGELGTLSTSATQTSVTLTTTLDTSSARSLDRAHVGDGRLACVDSIVMHATLQIASDDGALQDSFELELEAYADTFGGAVESQLDVTTHAFGGTLDWQPASGEGELFWLVSWVDDEAGSLRAYLVWGDAAQVELVGSSVEGEGVALVLAEIEAQA